MKIEEYKPETVDEIVSDLCLILSIMSCNRYSSLLEVIKGDYPQLENNEIMIKLAIMQIKEESKKNRKARNLISEARKLRNIMYKSIHIEE